jgi:hypothetical protein
MTICARCAAMPDIFARIVSLQPADEDWVVELCLASPSASLVLGWRAGIAVFCCVIDAESERYL